MHVDHTLRAGTLVKVVHVLCDQKELSLGRFAPVPLELRQCAVGGVRFSFDGLCPPLVVERANQIGIALKSFGRANRLDAAASPIAVSASKRRKSALCRDAGPGQDDDIHLVLMTSNLRGIKPAFQRAMTSTADTGGFAHSGVRLDFKKFGR
jgi:hypothetical protein